MYQITSDASSEPCDAPSMPRVGDSEVGAVLKLAIENSGGLGFYDCTGADPAMCNASPNLLLTRVTGPGTSTGTFDSETWGVIPQNATECTGLHETYFIQTTATEQRTATGIALTRTQWTGSLTGPDLCTVPSGPVPITMEVTAQQKAALEALPCMLQLTAAARRL
jgi:hypothetical protein